MIGKCFVSVNNAFAISVTKGGKHIEKRRMHSTIFSLVDRLTNIPYSYRSGSEGIRDINIWCKEENVDGYCRFLVEFFF